MLSDQRTETIVPATASALQRVVEAQSLPASGVVLEMHIPRSQRGNRPMHGHPIGVGTAMDLRDPLVCLLHWNLGFVA